MAGIRTMVKKRHPRPELKGAKPLGNELGLRRLLLKAGFVRRER